MQVLTRAEKIARVLAASRYRRHDYYMGSMAIADLHHVLGGQYGRTHLAELLEQATDWEVDSVLGRCRAILEHMDDHPTVVCPCCGSTVDASAVKADMPSWHYTVVNGRLVPDGLTSGP